VIASVRGTVTAVGADQAVLEVGGIGIAVMCTPGTLAGLRRGETAQLSTSLVVREDSLTLYGFTDTDERVLFELLQTASGVGPRLAQAVLAVHPPAAVRRAIATSDITALTRVPGIGKKGAERLVLELRDRIGPLTSLDVEAGSAVPPGQPWAEQVTDGLVGLGWAAKGAEQAVATISAERSEQSAAGEPDIADLLRRALRLLGRQR
jgi:Holliday junction DNA helicase RuvA